MNRCNFLFNFLFLINHSFAQHLNAVISTTRLPTPIYSMQVVYDGDDSIYVLGGLGRLYYERTVLRYNLTTERIQQVGFQTMDRVIRGSAVWAGNDSILYFGGYNYGGLHYDSAVRNNKPDVSSRWTKLGDLPMPVALTSSVWSQGEYSYVFGGQSPSGYPLNTISKYSSVTNNCTIVGELPECMDATTAVWNENTSHAYIFGGYGSGGSLNDIVKFNPKEETAIKLNVTLPEARYLSCAVWTGTVAYIIGGYSSGGAYYKAARFNPSTKEVLGIHINNVPLGLYYHGCVFVKKQNRIYIFGGRTRTGDEIPRNEILYIDLPGPTNPTTTSTTPTTTTITPSTTAPITTINIPTDVTPTTGRTIPTPTFPDATPTENNGVDRTRLSNFFYLFVPMLIHLSFILRIQAQE